VQQAVARLRSAAQPAGAPAAAPASQADMSGAERRTGWADAMATVAAEFTADLDKLPEAERAKEMMRIRVLTESASALVAGIAPPVGHPAGRGGETAIPWPDAVQALANA
jgi:hypothetical protein